MFSDLTVTRRASPPEGMDAHECRSVSSTRTTKSSSALGDTSFALLSLNLAFHRHPELVVQCLAVVSVRPFSDHCRIAVCGVSFDFRPVGSN